MADKRKSKRKGWLVATVLVLLGIIAVVGALGIAKSDFVKGIIADIEEANRPIPFQEIVIDEESLTSKYYYQQLGEEDKITYKEILQGIQNMDETIYIHETDGDSANEMLNSILCDMPGIFWCDGEVSTISFTDGKKEDYAIVKPHYIYTSDEVSEKQTQMEPIINECLVNVPVDGTEYDKVKYAFEYIINLVEYDMMATDSQNICSVFIEKKSVCAGYARATQYLLEQMGIQTTYVYGTSSNEIYTTPVEHAWNIVQLDGQYYHVDTTWGDPVFTPQEDSPELTQQERINYDYLCCDDNALFKTHTISSEIEVPACTSNAYDYFIMNGMYYDQYNPEGYQAAMNATISQKGKMTVFKFSSLELYTQSKDVIIGELGEGAANYLMSLYGLSETYYYYQEDSTLNKLVMYWEYD